MGFTFRRLKKLWILYLFLLCCSFFLFAFTINVYLESLYANDLRERNLEAHKTLRQKGKNNIIVGNYVGTGNIFMNMTKDEFNKNNFAPIESAGQLGNPVVIPAYETFLMKRMFQINHFNLLASDKIPLNRTLKDYRTNECANKKYPDDLPTTSIIIVFHNEAWSVLLRTIWSAINRSPKNLIKEIILVDDASTRDFLKDDLENYVKNLPVTTKIFRMPKRQGLVPARLKGANAAAGEVLTFLDAHCECSRGWLEPLLFHIKGHPKSVICPVIDIISDENFGYMKSFENHWGAFNWQLHFRWYVLDRYHIEKRATDVTQPIPTPAMAGGLFSINKKYFFEMGSYDENMKIWGGENVEMSFRIWQCGGSVEISPCSHVGHLFRKSSPYTFPGGVNEVLSTNLARAALVWMDQWADFFFMYNPLNSKLRKELNVTDRINLRNKLGCKSFEWYLKEVWPNNFFPGNDRFFGKIVSLNGNTKLTNDYEKYMYNIPSRVQIKSWSSLFKVLRKHADKLLSALDLDNDLCLRASSNETPYGNSVYAGAIVGNCKPTTKLQDMFVITPEGQVMTNENICLDSYGKNTDGKNISNVRLFQCYNNERQFWEYDVHTERIRHVKWNLCLSSGKSFTNGTTTVEAKECEDVGSQKWALIPLTWKF